MRIAFHDLRGILKIIIERGGKTFLDSLTINRIPRSKEDNRICPICHKKQGKGHIGYMITNLSAVRMFDDVYNTGRCAQHSLAWLHYLYEKFVEYLNYGGPQDRTIEGYPEAYVKMCARRLEHQNVVKIERLADFAPTFDPIARKTEEQELTD